MNKYDIILNGKKIISLYFNTLDEVIDYCHRNLSEYNITKDNIIIDEELIYVQYINEIIKKSTGLIYIQNKEYYLYKSNKGLIPINLWKQNDFYFDGCQYIDGYYDKVNNTIKPFEGIYTNPIGAIWTSPKEFIETFSDDKQLQFILYSFKDYKQSSLSKPKELKGIKQSFSVDYILKKCKCQVFMQDDDVWIKHKDYFSPSLELENEDIGMPLGYLCEKYLGKMKKEKFIYPDTWGDIVLRQEAWVCIKNLLHRIKVGDFETTILNQICRQQEQYHNMKDNELCCTTMERFWEKVIKECKKHIENSLITIN